MFFDSWASGKMEKIPRLRGCPKQLCYPNLPQVTLYNSQQDFPISIPRMRKVVSFLLDELNITTDGIIFHFVSKKKIASLHKTFFNDSSPTDCITFPMDHHMQKLTAKESCHLLGEAFICPKIAMEYSQCRKVDPLVELYRYVIHCLLHLIDYDDAQAHERLRMRRKERNCLKKLNDAGYLKVQLGL